MATPAPVDVDQLWHVAIATREIEPKLERLQSHLGIGPWALLEFEFPPGTATVFGRSAPMKVRAAAAQTGFLTFGFDQPLSDPHPFQGLLAERSSGAHHLACLVKDIAAARRTLRGFGYREILASDAVGPRQDSHVSYFDAIADLGTVIECSKVNSELPMTTLYGGGVMPATSAVHTSGAAYVGIAVRDAEKVAANYRRVLGFGPAQFTVLEMSATYRGEPARCALKLGVLRAASWVLRLIEPLGRGTPVHDFLERYGPGIHHFGLAVQDVRQSAAALRKLGYREMWSAHGFGPQLDGSAAQFDTEDALGIAIELCQPASGVPG